MRGLKNVTLREVCAGIEDPRADRVNKFSLVELLFAAMITVLCGATSYADMAQIGEKKLEWFRKYLPYDNGMPKAGTFRDVLCRLNPDEVHDAFIAWMKGAVETLQAAGVIAVDGKTAKGSKTGTQRPAHIVSAFSSAANLAIGQIACEEKSNEITAVPKLLEMLDIHGCLVTTDAMGAQREIAEQIVRQEGDYLLQVKGNQKFLYSAVKDALKPYLEERENGFEADFARTEDKGHGRTEIRECIVRCGRDWMGGTADKWPSVNFGAVIRNTTVRDGQETVSVHYFIGSRKDMSAAAVLESKRAHWSVENKLHWVLDVQFGEDASRIRTDHSAENVNALRQIACNVLRETSGLKGSFRSRQLECLLDDQVLRRAAETKRF